MAQEKVTRQELRDMHIGQTRIITLKEEKKISSARVTAQQMKNEKEGEWLVKPDYDSCPVRITRLK